MAQLVEHCSANAEATGSNPTEAPTNFFGLIFNCLNCNSSAMSHDIHFICIPAVHVISFCVLSLSRVDELNKLALSVWAFIAQLVEHCSANAETTGSNPVEAPKNFFRATSQFLKLWFNCDGPWYSLLKTSKTQTFELFNSQELRI